MIVILVLLVIFSHELFGRELPSYIKKCHLNDSYLNGCLRDNAEILRPYIFKGIPEFKIPVIDPLFLTQVTIDMGSFRGEFINGTISGASQFDLEELLLDVEKMYFRAVLFIPNIIVDGNYRLEGKIMMLQLKSAGSGIGHFRDVRAVIVLNGYLEDRQGKSYIKFNDTSFKLKLGSSSSFQFDNLFPGNDELTRATNKILNENVDQLFEEFMPFVEDVISAFTLNMILEIFKIFSLQELFIID